MMLPLELPCVLPSSALEGHTKKTKEAKGAVGAYIGVARQIELKLNVAPSVRMGGGGIEAISESP